MSSTIEADTRIPHCEICLAGKVTRPMAHHVWCVCFERYLRLCTEHAKVETEGRDYG